MGRGSIPVDLFNPGQVFACLGFLEAADQFLGEARGGFDWTDPSGDRFHISAVGDDNPVQAVLECLATAEVVALAPANTALSATGWNVPTTVLPSSAPFPISPPNSPATLPILLKCKRNGTAASLQVDHWGDSTIRDNVKFWAGSGGYPAAALFRDALDLVREELVRAARDPFAVSRPQSSSFRFDWRRDYVSIDAGFSPNEHPEMIMIGFPIVEMLAAIGLTHARPQATPGDKLRYRYGVLGVTAGGELYDPVFLRAALGRGEIGFPYREFLMRLDWPGRKNQARCITHVTEETGG